MGWTYRRLEQSDTSDEDNSTERRQSSTHHLTWSRLAFLVVIVVLTARCGLQELEIRRLESISPTCLSPNGRFDSFEAEQCSICFNANALIAELEQTTPVAWAGAGHWVNDDQHVENERWQAPDLEFSKGVVAVPDSWARERNIPLAQRWPWDSSKGVYLLGSTHRIHCLKSLRHLALESFEGKPPRMKLGHVKHCLSLLMQDTICHADDTLQYTGAVWANQNKTGQKFTAGEGQFRMCRSWTQLRDWATENSACYNATQDPRLPLTEFYKSCPDGDTPWMET